jgi:hypothetical protein
VNALQSFFLTLQFFSVVAAFYWRLKLFNRIISFRSESPTRELAQVVLKDIETRSEPPTTTTIRHHKQPVTYTQPLLQQKKPHQISRCPAQHPPKSPPHPPPSPPAPSPSAAQTPPSSTSAATATSTPWPPTPPPVLPPMPAQTTAASSSASQIPPSTLRVA